METIEQRSPGGGYRRAEVRLSAGIWEVRAFHGIQPGEVFRLFEPNGDPVAEGRCWRGHSVPLATVPPGETEPQGYSIQANEVSCPLER